MSIVFEELDFQQTSLGDISLRRRSEPRLAGKILYEVKLGDEFLMSSLFTDAEIQLAKIGLARLHGEKLDIVVGGLGLGYTAVAVLEDQRVNTLDVIEVMAPVIEWHQKNLVPLGDILTSDPRCRLVEADFFKLASRADCGFNIADPYRLAHAILLDIDHSPSHWLNQGNSSFYCEKRLLTLASKLHHGGIFGLWSNDPPDLEFTRLLESVFAYSKAHTIRFDNPYSGNDATNTVYIAGKNV